MDGFDFDANGEETSIPEAMCEHFFGEQEENTVAWGDDFDMLPEEECGYDPMDPNGIGEE